MSFVKSFLKIIFLGLGYISTSSEYINANGSLRITDEKVLNKTIKSALLGNSGDAFKLYEHYAMANEFFDIGHMWLEVAAENSLEENDWIGFYNWACCLERNDDIERQKYWYYLAYLNDKEKKYVDNMYPDFKIDEDNKDVIISESNVKEIEIKVKHGNKYLSLKLAQYYKDDDEKYKHWLRIGAQNGNKECMKKYAELLKQSSDEYDNIRAEFWEKKSK